MDYVIQDLTDGERVVLSANLLDTSEFEIFRQAWQQWFGRAADNRTLESEFSSYLFGGQAPPWVRHYTRALLQDSDVVQIRYPRLAPERLVERILDTRLARILLG